MNENDVFRVAAVIIVAFFLPIGLYHRIRAQTDEKLDRWQEGTFILFGLRLSGLPLCLGGIVWLIDPRWMAWSSLPIPIWLRWSGAAILAFGGVLLVWTFQFLSRNLTDTVVTRREHTLVTTGPYRWIRHPFYVAFAVGVIGISLVAGNWFLFLAGCVPFGFLVARTRIEEEKLVERFGDEYRDYMQETGRFLPKLGR